MTSATTPMPPHSSNPLVRALDALERVVMAAAVATLAGVVLTVVYQVVARYVTSQSTAWAPELSQTLFLWTALLAIPLGVRHGRHMLVNIWRGDNRVLQAIVATTASLVILGTCAALTMFGIEMLQTSFRRTLPGLGISSGWQMLAVPVGFGLSVVFQLEALIRRLLGSPIDTSARADQTV